MKSLLGPEELPVLSPKSWLARLYMILSHEEDHRRDARDTLFRSRKYAWVFRGASLGQERGEGVQVLPSPYQEDPGTADGRLAPT